MKPERKKSVFNFNHISKDLSEEEKEQLQNWYKYYHKLCTCYKWKYKKLKRIKLVLNMTSLSLTFIGTVLAPFTRLFTLSVTASGVIIQGYRQKSNLLKNTEYYKLGYNVYKDVLTELRSYLRGTPFDENMLLTSLKEKDDFVNSVCPPINGCVKKYDDIYGNI